MQISHKFVECVSSEWDRRIKHPVAFRAAPPHNALSFDPYQFAGGTFLALMMHTALTSGYENSTAHNRQGAELVRMLGITTWTPDLVACFLDFAHLDAKSLLERQDHECHANRRPYE